MLQGYIILTRLDCLPATSLTVCWPAIMTLSLVAGRHGSAPATCRACFRGYTILRHLGYIDVLRGGLYICWPGILPFAG